MLDDVLVLQVMVWPDEVRSAAGIAPGEAGMISQELSMAKSLIEALSADFPELVGGLRDDYQYALRDLVQAKLDHVPPAHEALQRPAKQNVVRPDGGAGREREGR